MKRVLVFRRSFVVLVTSAALTVVLLMVGKALGISIQNLSFLSEIAGDALGFWWYPNAVSKRPVVYKNQKRIPLLAGIAASPLAFGNATNTTKILGHFVVVLAVTTGAYWWQHRHDG